MFVKFLQNAKAIFKHPIQNDLPFNYKVGPLYNNNPAEQAIYQSELALPRKEVWGSGTPVRGQLITLPGQLSLTRKAVPTVGINQQTGQYALQTSTLDGGQFIDYNPDTADAAELGAISV